MANVSDPVRRHAESNPEDIALRGERNRWTYRALHTTCLAYADSLRTKGIGIGDRVMLVAPSVPEFVIAYLGIQAAGAIVVPVNTMSAPRELDYVLDDAGCALAIGWHELDGAVAEAAAARGISAWTLRPAEAAAGSVTGAAEQSPDDTAAILYTSGTTGRPKGAQLTVGNLLSAGEISAECSRGDRTDRTGTGLPLFHVFGQASVMMAALTSGSSLSLLPRFDPMSMLAMLRRDQLTIMAGVPTMWNAMLHAAGDADPADFAGLRVAVSGGAPLPSEVTRAFEARFGCTILEGYGLTETTAMATFDDIDHGGTIGTAGRAVPRTQVRLRDLEGRDCPHGTVGEVYVNGPTVMKGYWNRPADTAAALDAEGWFRTGDLGTLDSSGDLRIVDRIKDLIIRGGYNVYPGEVEEVLYTHPDVVEAAVVGVPDDHYGEEVAAVLAVRDGSELTAAEVTNWSRERLSAYKVPRLVHFVETLPKGSTGKILKRSIDRTALTRLPRADDDKAQ